MSLTQRSGTQPTVRRRRLPPRRFASNAKAEHLDVAGAGSGPFYWLGLTFHGNNRLLVSFALPFRLIITRDHHGPVGVFATWILRTGNPDAGCIVQQQVLAVPGRVDPLAERLLETVVAVSNILGGTPRTRRRDPPGKRAEHFMTEIILRRHRSRLIQGDAVKGCVASDSGLAMLEPEARDQFRRRLGGHYRGGQ